MVLGGMHVTSRLMNGSNCHDQDAPAPTASAASVSGAYSDTDSSGTARTGETDCEILRESPPAAYTCLHADTHISTKIGGVALTNYPHPPALQGLSMGGTRWLGR